MIPRPLRFAALLAAFSFLMVAAPLRAGEVKYPETGPGVTLTVPGSWSTSKKDGNVSLVSPDGKVVITLTRAVGNKTAGEAAKAFASGAGMEDVDLKEMPESEENGTKVSAAVAVGKHKGEDYVTTVMKITTTEGTKLAIIAFGEKAAVLDSKEVDGIMNSVK